MEEALLLSLVEKARNKLNIEETNLDLKIKWWDFKIQTNEFTKDICSMANTHYGDSFIIIGLGEEGKLYNAPLPEDEANIQAKLKDKIEPRVSLTVKEIQVENKILSVVTIPHSKNRPHIIKNYKNHGSLIPIRVGTSTQDVSRADLDAMYEERSSKLTSDIKVELIEKAIRWANFASYQGSCFAVWLLFDNYGGMPDYIIRISLVEKTGNHWKSQHFLFDHSKQVDGALRLDPYDRKNVLVYLSDEIPGGYRGRKPIPDIDRDSLKLEIKTRSNKSIAIDIKPGWVIEGS